MKLLIVATALITCLQYCSAADLKCFVGAAGAPPTSDACSGKSNTLCSGPLFKEYEGLGLSKAAYACGPCADQNVGGALVAGTDCKECNIEECNIEVPAGTTFKCYAWSWDAAASPAATKKGDELTCHLADQSTTVKKCHQPTETSAVATTAGGCGPCPTGTESAGTCKECPGGDSACNSAAAFTTLLALAALFYNMM